MDEKRPGQPGEDWLHTQWFVVLCLTGMVLGTLSIYATYQQLGDSLYFGGGAEGVVVAAIVFQAEFVIFSAALLLRGLRKPELTGRYGRYMLIGLGGFVLLGCMLVVVWFRMATWFLD